MKHWNRTSIESLSNISN